MLPYITILGRTIPMYGLLTGVGFLLAVLYLELSGGRGGASGDTELALVYGVIGAFAGAKLVYLLTVWPEFCTEWRTVFTQPAAFAEKYLFAGFVFYGGLFGCIAAVWLYGCAAKVPFSQLAETMTPVLPLIHGFGRIGCFCEGCCYGRPTENLILGVVFQNSKIAPNGVPLLPVQLMEAGLELGLFACLVWLAGKGRGRWMLPVYLLVYGAARFILEFYRGDAYRGSLGPLSVSQVLSAAAVLAGLLLLWKQRNALFCRSGKAGY